MHYLRFGAVEDLVVEFEIGFRKLKKRRARSAPANIRQRDSCLSLFSELQIVIAIFSKMTKLLVLGSRAVIQRERRHRIQDFLG
jgi:hypothetical protein